VFATELSALASEARALLFDAIDLAVSGRSWDQFRETLGLSPEQAQARVELIVRSLLQAR
jgi:hypothetical protein